MRRESAKRWLERVGDNPAPRGLDISEYTPSAISYVVGSQWDQEGKRAGKRMRKQSSFKTSEVVVEAPNTNPGP